MIRIVITLLLYLVLSLFNLQAQTQSFEEKAKVLSNQIERITSEERLALKETLKEINKKVNAKKITDVEAYKLKNAAAEKSAKHIQERVSIIEDKLFALVQNKVDNEIFLEENRRRFSIGNFDVDYTRNQKAHKDRDFRTTSRFVIAFGLNNAITNQSFNSLENSEFEFWKSRFFEWGLSGKTRVFKASSLWYVDYGFSVMYNSLSPKQNQYYVANGTSTSLQEHALNLNKSKFKNVQFVFPMFLELDFSKPKMDKEQGNIRYRINRGLRIGAGGFAGVRIKTKQILKYKQDGKRRRDVQKGDFNTNNFVYGLNAFIGYRDTSFYVKYDLNTLFRSNVNVKNNVSFGVRFDL